VDSRVVVGVLLRPSHSSLPPSLPLLLCDRVYSTYSSINGRATISPVSDAYFLRTQSWCPRRELLHSDQKSESREKKPKSHHKSFKRR